MHTVISILLPILISLAGLKVAYEASEVIQEVAIKRIHKGLSKSEPFAQKLTGKKLRF